MRSEERAVSLHYILQVAKRSEELEITFLKFPVFHILYSKGGLWRFRGCGVSVGLTAIRGDSYSNCS